MKIKDYRNIYGNYSRINILKYVNEKLKIKLDNKHFNIYLYSSIEEVEKNKNKRILNNTYFIIKDIEEEEIYYSIYKIIREEQEEEQEENW